MSHAVHCRRCGRALSNPKSMERGFGPICYRKMVLHQIRGEWEELRQMQNEEKWGMSGGLIDFFG